MKKWESPQEDIRVSIGRIWEKIEKLPDRNFRSYHTYKEILNFLGEHEINESNVVWIFLVHKLFHELMEVQEGDRETKVKIAIFHEASKRLISIHKKEGIKWADIIIFFKRNIDGFENDEIAEEYGISVPRVSQICSFIESKLADNGWDVKYLKRKHANGYEITKTKKKHNSPCSNCEQQTKCKEPCGYLESLIPQDRGWDRKEVENRFTKDEGGGPENLHDIDEVISPIDPWRQIDLRLFDSEYDDFVALIPEGKSDITWEVFNAYINRTV